MDSESEEPLLVTTQLVHAERVLTNARLSTPREEARSLLGSLLGVSSALLLAQPDRHMSPLEVKTYAAWIARRAAGEALPHITGRLEFMGLDIMIGRHGPLPPPGAQQVVETALEWTRRRAPGELLAAEITTGCGAIALALAALEPCYTHIYAVEASPAALDAARANGARYLLNLVISWLDGEGLDAVPEPVDLIVCAQPDRIDFIKAPPKLRPGGALICAVDEAQRLATDDALVRSCSMAPVWMESRGEGPALVVAQRWGNAAGG